MRPTADKVDFARPEHLRGLELLTASYAPRNFPIHVHPELVIGAIVEGAERLTTRADEWTISSGSVLVIPPDEAHANSSVNGERMGYRVFYVPSRLAQEIGGGALPAPAVIHDPSTYRDIVASHVRLSVEKGAMEQEWLLSNVLERTMSRCLKIDPPLSAPNRIALARDFLEENYLTDCSLSDVANVAGLSIFHFTRAFRAQFGVSPIAFRNQRRIMEARRLLRNGVPIAEAALAVGLADQSHLTRMFQQIMGTTPGKYAQQ